MEQTQVQSGGKNRLVLKDLINIGIFTVVYLAGILVVGMPLGFLVVTSILYPFVGSLFLGVVALFFLAKTPKPFALFIFTAILGFFMMLMGQSAVMPVHTLIIAALAELARKAFGYKTVKGCIAGYAVMSLWTLWRLLADFYLKRSILCHDRKNNGSRICNAAYQSSDMDYADYVRERPCRRNPRRPFGRKDIKKTLCKSGTGVK